MNIALLADNLAFGGINRYCLDLAKGLQSYPDLEVALLALGDRNTPWLLDEAAARGIQVEVLPMHSVFDLRVVRQLRHLLLERRMDILHSQGYRSNLIARLAVRAGRLPTKLIWTVHGAYHFPTAPLRSRLFFALDYLTMGTMDRVIAVSEMTRQQLTMWESKDKTCVIYNGTVIPPPNDAKDRWTNRQTLGIPPDARVVLFVGRFSLQKGIPMLAEVIRKTLAGRDDVLFLVVGSGDLAAELESCAQEFGSRVMLTGPQRDVTPFYAVADVLFLPSRTEGLPLVLLEAFAHGVPVVASNVGGVPEVVEDGINGFLCDAKDTAQMHERLVQLLGDIALRRSFGVQARSTAEARFSLDRMILETCQVYRSLVPIGAA